MGLLDLFRRKPTGPTEAPPTGPPPAPNEQAGAGGTSTYGGYVDNRESSASLRGSQRQKTFQEIVLNVAIASAAVRRTLRLVGGVAWTMSPARGDQIDEAAASEAADFAARAILEAPRTATPTWVKRIASAEFFGFAIQEWSMRADDDPRWPGRLVFDRIDQRACASVEQWDVDATGEVFGVWHRPATSLERIYLPRWKLLYHVDDELTDSPEGVGLLRHAAETVRRLGIYLAIEGKGFQNSVNGNMIGRVPAAELDALSADKKTRALAGLKDYLENHRKKEDLSITLDSSTYKNPDGSPSNVPKWSIETLTAGNDLKELGESIRRDLWLVAIALNVEHIMLGSAGGSLAMQAQKSADYYRFVEGMLKGVAHAIRRDLIEPLWLLNGLDPALMPTPQFSRLTFHDVTEVLAGLRDLATAGVTLDRADDAAKVIFEFLGLPVLEDDPAELTARRDAVGLAPIDPATVDPGDGSVDVNLDAED